MKLLIAIIHDRDAEQTLDLLVEADFLVTQIASIGGFLRKKNVTLLIATEEERVDEVVGIIRRSTTADEKDQRRATVFILNLVDFEQL